MTAFSAFFEASLKTKKNFVDEVKNQRKNHGDPSKQTALDPGVRGGATGGNIRSNGREGAVVQQNPAGF